MLLTQIVQNCSICRRPVRLRSQPTDHDTSCTPCRGGLVAHEIDDDQPTALLVDYRDEVFTRIATDMAQTGLCIVRAESADEALKLTARYKPVLVVANTDLPDQSGWLLAAKLRIVAPHVRVWLFRAHSSTFDEGMAAFLHVDQFLDYGGDLLRLSDKVTDVMAQLTADNAPTQPPCD